MSRPAQVHSVEALELFRTQLAKFEHQVQRALDSLSIELNRVTDWLSYDRPGYWKQQTKLADAAVLAAKLDLERCLIFPVAGEKPACREEKMVLKRARQRAELCRKKSQRVKHWNRQLQHEFKEFEGRVGHLRRLLETEIPTARAKLEQIVRRLQEYQIEQPPQALPPQVSYSRPAPPESEQ